MIETILFSLVLVVFAGVMIALHLCDWRTAQQDPDNEDEYNYRWRQFRRRMQATVMVAVVAVMLPFALIKPMMSVPWVLTIYIFVLIGLVMWIGVLAVADMVASRRRLTQLQDDVIIERAKLELEIRRQQEELSTNQNGHSNGAHRAE